MHQGCKVCSNRFCYTCFLVCELWILTVSKTLGKTGQTLPYSEHEIPILGIIHLVRTQKNSGKKC